jgi:hypothetical protein
MIAADFLKVLVRAGLRSLHRGRTKVIYDPVVGKRVVVTSIGTDIASSEVANLVRGWDV